ncbi:peptide/nickel transport system substrate-binding protein [Prauserella sediminis]|uniref:Peptide/nickel transport system substrate-binding protein n=1 Tax=Prauserella sediminis TaxID=577680 RepID=A0A839XS89_9PSEU|nr:ABC transporter substrate-binding protein [Prauserella sediminis]MBB3665607.1 peptide/nickel transport system substrate-binding protein [Prauserella sediminis]
MKTTAVVLAGLLTLTACGGGGAGAGVGPSGDPVQGGSARILIQDDPRSLDPAMLSNEAAFTASVGNALYGQLIVNDQDTGEISYLLAQDLTSKDAGETFTLTLKEGLEYSDGSPLTADDVKFNWEHIADPAAASSYAGNAREIESLKAVDDRTLTIKLRNPNTQFASEIYETSLNWIAKPETIQAGPEEINSRPIGAGPFVLTEWRRQDAMVFSRNKSYFDKPRPYLDTLEIGMVQDEEQRLNTVVSGGADLAQETQFPAISGAEQQGLQVARTSMGGGVALVLNNDKAPFDDVRARKALSYGLDLNLINDAVNDGTGTVPNTLFPKNSPFFQDIPLHRHDPDRAQALLDELAAEGKPLDFTMTIYSSPAAQRLAQSMQTQLSALKGVTMKTRAIEIAETGQVLAAGDFDILTSSIPDTALWLRLRGEAGNNYSGVDDPQLNQALDAARRATDQDEVAAKYKTVQQRLSELTPVIFYTGLAMAAYGNTDVGGIELYGKGSPRVDMLWTQP